MFYNCDNVNIVNTIIKISFFVFAFITLMTIFFNYQKYKNNNYEKEDFYKKIFIKVLLIVLFILIPIIIDKTLLTPYKVECIKEEEIKEKESIIKNELITLKESLLQSDYEKIENEINGIDDFIIQNVLRNELASIYKYVKLTSNIELLKVDYNLKDYYNLYKEIEKITDNNIKTKLINNINSLGKGKPLDVTSGFNIKRSGDIAYYEGIPLHPIENMPLVIVMQAYNCHVDFGKNQSKYIDEEFFFLAPDVGMHNDNLLKEFKTLIDEIVTKYKINKNKIIITGHSNGARSTLKLVSFYPGYFSAVVPVGAHPSISKSDDHLKTSFYGICGTGETCKETMKNFIESITRRGGNAKYFIPEGDHMDTGCSFLNRDVLNWVFAQEKK